MKDFLFLNYSWVPNSTYLFNGFRVSGYDCDFVDQHSIVNFIPTTRYKVVVAYLHESYQIPIINHLMREYFQDSFFVQHDDTDEEHIQQYYERSPDLIMHRELTANSKNPYKCPTYPQHFPIADIYRPEDQEKNLDVVFIGTPSHPRRLNFVHKLVELSQGKLKHLKWGLMYGPNKNPALNIKAINNAKIGVNYPGNSYDSWRIWELAAAGCGIIMPELPLLSVNENHQPFDEYVRINTDISDLEEKIIWLIENDRWKDWGKKARLSYLTFHKPEKCFEHYHDLVMKHVPINKREIVHHSAEPYYAEWRKHAL